MPPITVAGTTASGGGWLLGVTTASNPAANARRLVSTPTPAARTVSSNAARGKGRAADPASAPNNAAEITAPLRSASACMSADRNRRAAVCAAATTPAESARPSPGLAFSVTASARWVEAISVVRSGETSPRMMARPASIISAATTTSTSPGTGISDSTGAGPAAGG